MVINTEERRSIKERVSRIEGGYDHLATKEDVANVRTDVAGVRTDIANVRTEAAESEARNAQRTAESEARNRRWLIAIGGLIVAAITLLDRLFG